MANPGGGLPARLRSPVDPINSAQEQAEAFAAAQVPINAPEVTPIPFKSVDLTLEVPSQPGSSLNYRFQYDNQQKLQTISAQTAPIFQVETLGATTVRQTLQQLTGEYTLNAEGLGTQVNGVLPEGGPFVRNYLYRNGYLVSSYGSGSQLTTRHFSPEGDLLAWKGEAHNGQSVNATYTYITYPNTIRQEVFRWEAAHFAFRGDFLGKYSTHLVEQAQFRVGQVLHTLNFSYTFDEQGRVETMSIARTEGTAQLPNAQYRFSY